MKTALQSNLAEEKAMAQWLGENLESVMTKFLSLREAGEKANVFERSSARAGGIALTSRLRSGDITADDRAIASVPDTENTSLQAAT